MTIRFLEARYRQRCPTTDTARFSWHGIVADMRGAIPSFPACMLTRFCRTALPDRQSECVAVFGSSKEVTLRVRSIALANHFLLCRQRARRCAWQIGRQLVFILEDMESFMRVYCSHSATSLRYTWNGRQLAIRNRARASRCRSGFQLALDRR